MNKEKLAELFLLAVERKANINIHFGQFHKDADFTEVTNEEAFTLASHFKEALNAPSLSHDIGGSGTKQYNIDHGEFRVCVSYIPDCDEQKEARRQRIETLERQLAKLKQEEAM